MARQYAVIGLGRFGMEVAQWLSSRKHSVLAIDSERSLIDKISTEVDRALSLDSTDEDALREARVHEMDVVVVAIGDQNIQNSILTTALLQKLGARKIIARASTELHARILTIVGAHDVVNPEKEMGQRVAQRIAIPGLSELFPLDKNATIAELPIPQSFIGKTLVDLRVRNRYNINIIGVRRTKDTPSEDMDTAPAKNVEATHELELNPSPDTVFQPHDVLVVAGTEQSVKNLAALD
jgi:trk system potassium uptake protein